MTMCMEAERRSVAPYAGRYVCSSSGCDQSGRAPARIAALGSFAAIGFMTLTAMPVIASLFSKAEAAGLSAAMLTSPGELEVPNAAAGGRLLWQVQATPDFTVQNASGPTGEALPLNISIPSMTANYSFLMFRDLPEGFTFTAGFRTKEHWVVSLRDADSVRLVPPAAYEGSFPLQILLIRGRGQDPERRVAKIEFRSVKPPSQSLQTAATAAVETPARQPARSPATPAAARAMNAEEASLMERADRLLREGDIAAARLIYSRLAHSGLANAALAMARSYDPDFLGSLSVAGLQPDTAQARSWYRQAEELGSPSAASRLGTLREAGR